MAHQLAEIEAFDPDQAARRTGDARQSGDLDREPGTSLGEIPQSVSAVPARAVEISDSQIENAITTSVALCSSTITTGKTKQAAPETAMTVRQAPTDKTSPATANAIRAIRRMARPLSARSVSPMIEHPRRCVAIGLPRAARVATRADRELTVVSALRPRRRLACAGRSTGVSVENPSPDAPPAQRLR